MNRFESSTVTIKPYAETATYGFDLKAIDASGPTVHWKPNTTSTSGVEIFLNGLIGFGIAGRGVMSNEDRLNKGDTTYEDWRLTLTYPSLLVSLDYARFRGFYIDNTTDIDASLPSGGPKIKAPDMALQNYDLGFTWIFAPDRFSLEAAVDQTVRQEESGGSWLAGASFFETDVSNETSIVPSQQRTLYGADQNVTTARFTAFSFAARLRLHGRSFQEIICHHRRDVGPRASVVGLFGSGADKTLRARHVGHERLTRDGL